MAVITFSPLVVAASGKVKDTVFARWKGRPYIRARVTPANPKSSAQVKQRAISTAGVTQWQNTHADFVVGWNLYASPYSISGFNACHKRNCSTASPHGNGTHSRMELAAAIFPALMQPTPGAQQLTTVAFGAGGSGEIWMTWAAGTWLAADSVYLAAWDEDGITYYPAPQVAIVKAPGNALTITVAGLTVGHVYTLAAIVHDDSEDTWGANIGAKAEAPGA